MGFMLPPPESIAGDFRHGNTPDPIGPNRQYPQVSLLDLLMTLAGELALCRNQLPQAIAATTDGVRKPPASISPG